MLCHVFISLVGVEGGGTNLKLVMCKTRVKEQKRNTCGQEIEEYILLDCLAAHVDRLSIYPSPLCILCKENNSKPNQDNLPDCTVLNSENTH
jgi:hypothetical protein